jgi:hypothetical protein
VNTNKWKHKLKSLGTPSTETSDNLKAPEITLDKRTLKKTGRTEQFGTRVNKEWLQALKTISQQERLRYVEVLEDALACYQECGKHRIRKKP